MDPPINHRSMLHQYTQKVSHIEECTYTHLRWTPLPIDNRSMLHHYTQYISHIEECTYTHGRWCCIDLCSSRGGGPSAMGICAVFYM